MKEQAKLPVVPVEQQQQVCGDSPLCANCTLDTVAPGTTVQVCHLGQSNPKLFCKLHAMGLVSGSSVTVVGRAPLGDPISISTLGYQLSLRLAEARSIGVLAP